MPSVTSNATFRSRRSNNPQGGATDPDRLFSSIRRSRVRTLDPSLRRPGPQLVHRTPRAMNFRGTWSSVQHHTRTARSRRQRRAACPSTPSIGPRIRPSSVPVATSRCRRNTRAHGVLHGYVLLQRARRRLSCALREHNSSGLIILLLALTCTYLQRSDSPRRNPDPDVRQTDLSP